MQSRRKAREQVLELLYQLDIADLPLANGLQLYQEKYCQKKNANPLVKELLQQAVQHHSEVDALIKSTVEHWKFDRLAVLDRNILRLAIAELLYLDNIPVNATLNEAVELAKKFSTVDSGKFVNGVLDKIVKLKNIVKN